MPYVHAGAHAITIRAANDIGQSVTNTHVGVQTGVGAEVKITERISADVRYSFSYTGARAYDFGGGASIWSQTGNTISTAINLRF
jgi:opacity protein-like surface antigen